MDKPVGHSYTAYGTPMHVAQLALLMLKATFAELGGNDYQFKFTNDFNTTGILIDTQYNKDSYMYGRKPALIVNRGAISSQQFAIGDRAVHNLKTNNEVRSSLVNSGVEVKIISKASMEVEILSNEVFNFLLMCRRVFPNILGLHSADTPGLTPITPYEQDDSMYYCVGSLPFSMQYKWVHLVPQTILDNIGFYNDDNYVFNIFNS
jgi:hypothetical protein